MPLDDKETARLQKTADQVEIMEVLSSYSQLIDARDWDALGRVFTEDAECGYIRELDGVSETFPPAKGIEGIRKWLETSLRPVETMHYMLNHVFTSMEGDRAHTRSYLLVRGTQTGGVYDGDHVRTQDGWRVAALTLEQHFTTE
jgi:ketosteroid isomerase-like protein